VIACLLLSLLQGERASFRSLRGERLDLDSWWGSERKQLLVNWLVQGKLKCVERDLADALNVEIDAQWQVGRFIQEDISIVVETLRIGSRRLSFGRDVYIVGSMAVDAGRGRNQCGLAVGQDRLHYANYQQALSRAQARSWRAAARCRHWAVIDHIA